MLANGDVVQPIGRVMLHLQFGEHRVRHSAWVMKGGQFDLILGVDFFAHQEASFHFAAGKQHIRLDRLQPAPTVNFEIKQAQTFRGAASPIVTEETVLLQPGKRYRTPVRLLAGDNLAHVKALGLIEGVGKGTLNEHRVTDAVAVLEDGTSLVEMVNFSEKPVVVYKGTLIASCTMVQKERLPPSDAPVASSSHVPDDLKLENPSGSNLQLCTVNLEDLATPKEDCPLDEEGLPIHLAPKLEAAKKVLTDAQHARLKKLLISFNDVFARDYSKPSVAAMEPMRINIPDDATPVCAPRRRFSPAERALIHGYAVKLLANGVLERSDSEWRSNVLLVPKPDGTWRVCLDFREVNKLTVTTSSNLPSLADNLDLLGGKKIYSSFDILSAYWSCDLYKPHRKYTGFFVPGIGNLQFKRAAMGLSNAGTHFVKLTLKMLEGTLFDFVAAYADDIFVYSDSIDQHIDEHLPEVLRRFRKYNVSLKGSKAEICVTQLDWCGYRISTEGLSADPKKVAAITDMRRPRTLRQLRSFLGCCNFLRRWVPHFADIMDPLRILLKKGHFKKKWTEAQVQAWEDLRAALADTPVLAHPRFDRPFYIHCDTSTVALGGALLQKSDEGEFQVVAYLSKSLSAAQRNYSIHEVEALSVLYALETWHTYLFGQAKVDVFCDSQAVCWLFKPNSKYEGRCMRWALRASRWPVHLHHVKGKNNHIADALSRCPAEDGSQTPRHEPEALCCSRCVESAATRDPEGVAAAMTRSQSKAMPRGTNPASAPDAQRTTGPSDTTPLGVTDESPEDEKTTTADTASGQAAPIDPDYTGMADTTRDEVRDPPDHNPWENIFPNCEFEDDILALRPALVLWHRVPDKVALFRKHQSEDSDTKTLRESLESGRCLDTCTGCRHDPGCKRAWWRITKEGLLTKCTLSAPLPRRRRAVQVYLDLLKPCTCGGASTKCPHFLWTLTPRTAKVAPDPAAEDREAQHMAPAYVPDGVIAAGFDGFEVRRRTHKLVVPRSLVTSVLYHVHGSGVAGHPGATKSTARAAKVFWWRKMRQDIRRWVGACLRCQQRKPPRPKNVNTPGRTTLPSGPMQEIYIDFSGPYPETTRGNRWILTIVCAYARYPIAVPLPNRKAVLVVRALLEHVVQHYSCPAVMVSDGAREFVGQAVADFCSVFGIRHHVNPAYSPSLASYVERYHGWQNACLTIVTSRFKDTWDLMLPLVSLSYTTTVQAATGKTPFEALRGYEPRMPFDAWNTWSSTPEPVSPEVSRIREQMREVYQAIRLAHDKATARGQALRSAKHRPTEFTPGEVVLRFAPKTAEKLPKSVTVKPKLMDRWSLPCIVVARGEKGIYVVRDELGKLHDVRADLIRRYTFFTDGIPSIPPRRRFTKQERLDMNKGDKGEMTPRTAATGDLVCFPMETSKGPGFGVGKVLVRTPDLTYDVQFYSNHTESLQGTFSPCWLNSAGHWYPGRRLDGDIPMRTSDYYGGPLRQESFAAVGFRLLASGRMPSSALKAMDAHPGFRWTLPGRCKED